VQIKNSKETNHSFHFDRQLTFMERTALILKRELKDIFFYPQPSDDEYAKQIENAIRNLLNLSGSWKEEDLKIVACKSVDEFNGRCKPQEHVLYETCLQTYSPLFQAPKHVISHFKYLHDYYRRSRAKGQIDDAPLNSLELVSENLHTIYAASPMCFTHFLFSASSLAGELFFNSFYECLYGSDYSERFLHYYICSFMILAKEIMKASEKPSNSVIAYYDAYLAFAKLCCCIRVNEDGEIFVLRLPKYHLNREGELHADGKAAIDWGGDYKLYFLNGVQVPEYIALTPEEKLDPKLYFSENNVEVRRQIAWKIGLTRILSSLDNVELIDSKPCYGIKDMYRLYKYRHGWNWRVFLRMKNPSLPINPERDEYVEHCEFVHPNCSTVEEAIIFRNGLKERGFEIDEENGLPYYQQGDVLIFPENTNKLKSVFPERLS